jgi:hypothetical protein
MQKFVALVVLVGILEAPSCSAFSPSWVAPNRFDGIAASTISSIGQRQSSRLKSSATRIVLNPIPNLQQQNRKYSMRRLLLSIRTNPSVQLSSGRSGMLQNAVHSSGFVRVTVTFGYQILLFEMERMV